MDKIKFEIREKIAYIALANPKKHNAFDDVIIAQIRSSLSEIRKENQIRALVLSAEGKNFCAGADLAWMKRMANLSYAENKEDAQCLAALMEELYSLPIPTIAVVQGAAFGGALGLIACSDIVLCSDDAKFCLSEAKLGLAPATIGPYVVKALGSRIAKKLFLTAEIFNAKQALDYELVHKVVKLDELSGELKKTIHQILQTGPISSIETKALVHLIDSAPDDLSEKTSDLIAKLRVSDEGQAGLESFFNKTSAPWVESSGQ